jgi:hypothetical protein
MTISVTKAKPAQSEPALYIGPDGRYLRTETLLLIAEDLRMTAASSNASSVRDLALVAAAIEQHIARWRTD